MQDNVASLLYILLIIGFDGVVISRIYLKWT